MMNSSHLSARQEAFAVAYARHHKASQAAREAGYSKGCPSVTSTRLRANTSVLERIRELEAVTATDMAMSRERLLAELVAAAELAKTLSQPMGIVAAYREIAKICGFYQPEQVRVVVDLAGQGPEATGIKSADDLDWHQYVDLVLKPDPSLSPAQRRGIERDYAMKNGTSTVTCRKAMLFYTLRTLNFEIDGVPRSGEKQLVIANLAEIKLMLSIFGQA